jgi:hypothetical protein
VDIERHAVDRLHDARAREEVGREIAHLEEAPGHGALPAPRRSTIRSATAITA